jgi:hypothetical protein
MSSAEPQRRIADSLIDLSALPALSVVGADGLEPPTFAL